MADGVLPRGIRNQNPGNIRTEKGVRWQGADVPQTDDSFVVFSDAKWGIRAICRILINYQDNDKALDGSRIDTIDEIIGRWAPAVENDTNAYAADVAKITDIGLTTTVDVYQYETMKGLVQAIIHHENGQMPYTPAQIDQGLALAGIVAPTGTTVVSAGPPKPISKSLTVRGSVFAGAMSLFSLVLNNSDTIMSAVNQAVAFLTPYQDAAPKIRSVVNVLAIIGAAAAFMGRLRLMQTKGV